MSVPSVPPFATRQLRTEQLISHAIRSRKSDQASIQAVAATIYRDDMPHNATIGQQINALFTISYSMLLISQNVLGHATTTGPNAKYGSRGLIADALVAEIAKNNHHSSADLAYIQAVLDTIDVASDNNGHGYRLLWNLHSMATSVMQLRRYAEYTLQPGNALLERVGISLKALGPSVADVSDEVAAELAEMRRYGVKPSFFQDGMMHRPNEAWVIMPPPNFVEKSLLALTALSLRSELSDLEPKAQIMPDGMEASIFPMRAMLVMTINRDGHLSQGTNGYAGISTQEILRSAGQEEWYETLRLMQLMRLYDLVVPIESVATLPTWPQQSPGRILSGLVKKVAKLNLTPDLILPRLKLLQNSHLLHEQLEREVDLAIDDTRERALMHRHDVVDHIRHLPVGKSPTPAARERAREALGIELTDHETYVRPHKRGAGDEIKSHRAVRRSTR